MSPARDASAWLRTPLVQRGASVLAWGEPSDLAARLLVRDAPPPSPRAVAGEAVAPRTVSTRRRMGLPELPTPAPLLVRQQPKKLLGEAAASFRRAAGRAQREPLPARTTVAATVAQATADRAWSARPEPSALDPRRERVVYPRGMRAARSGGIDPSTSVLGSDA